MTARPIYTILVEDMVSHVEWTLMRDDDEVVAGRVELTITDRTPLPYRLAFAFGVAWRAAEKERNRRLLEDLECGQVEEEHLAKIEQERSEAELQDALDEGGGW
jgi:hypothetical protein